MRELNIKGWFTASGLSVIACLVVLVLTTIMVTSSANASYSSQTTTTQEQCDFLRDRAEYFYQCRWYMWSAYVYGKYAECVDNLEPVMCPVECDRTADIQLTLPSGVRVTTTTPYDTLTIEYINGGTRVYGVAWFEGEVFADSFGEFENTPIKGITLNFECDNGAVTYFDLDR